MSQPDRYLIAVYADVVQSAGKEIRALLEERFAEIDQDHRHRFMAAALGTAAQCIDGVEIIGPGRNPIVAGGATDHLRGLVQRNWATK